MAIADVAFQIMFGGDTFQIVQNFRAGRTDMAPLGIGRKGIAIGHRRHITGNAGIAVVAPCTAKAVGLFEYRDIVDARSLISAIMPDAPAPIIAIFRFLDLSICLSPSPVSRSEFNT